MIAEIATAGALVVDSYTYSTGGTTAEAQALAKAGVKCLVGYLGAMTPARVGYLHANGIAFMAVTFGTAPEHYNGATSAAQCRALGLPAGCSVWLDLEGMAAYHTDPATLLAEARAWAYAVRDAGFMPCLYVGSPQPLTNAELYSLPHVRYWLGQGLPRDRFGHDATPACGWCMVQKYPSTFRGGVSVDDDAVMPDKEGRLPVWAAP